MKQRNVDVVFVGLERQRAVHVVRKQEYNYGRGVKDTGTFSFLILSLKLARESTSRYSG